VWNYAPLFRSYSRLAVDSKPQVGEWAFYGKRHVGLVVEAGPDGRFQVIEASPVRGHVMLSDSQYMERVWGAPTCFGRLKRG